MYFQATSQGKLGETCGTGHPKFFKISKHTPSSKEHWMQTIRQIILEKNSRVSSEKSKYSREKYEMDQLCCFAVQWQPGQRFSKKNWKKTKAKIFPIFILYEKETFKPGVTLFIELSIHECKLRNIVLRKWNKSTFISQKDFTLQNVLDLSESDFLLFNHCAKQLSKQRRQFYAKCQHAISEEYNNRSEFRTMKKSPNILFHNNCLTHKCNTQANMCQQNLRYSWICCYFLFLPLQVLEI